MMITLMNKDQFPEDEQIRAFFHAKQGTSRPHTNEYWEIAYIYEGDGKNTYDGGTQTVTEGSFILTTPGACHSIASNPNTFVRICNCIFTAEYFNTLKNELTSVKGIEEYELYKMLFRGKSFCLTLSDDNAKNVRHLIWLIAHEYNHFTDGSEIIIGHAAVDLLIIIIRLYEYSIKKASGTVSRNDEIDRLMKYMRSNFGYNLTLQALAEQVHLSREYLSRYFKQYTGKTISAFLTEIRINRAKEMLKNSSYPIADIGAYCGYPSVSNFQKAFKKNVNMSPSAYRKQARGQV